LNLGEPTYYDQHLGFIDAFKSSYARSVTADPFSKRDRLWNAAADNLANTKSNDLKSIALLIMLAQI
jgi:hypothetical protein